MELDYKIIGKRIRETRKAKGITQDMLSETVGCEPSTISHIERAATKVSLPTLVGIANALDVTLDDLVYTNLNKSSNISVKIINEQLLDCTPNELKALTDIIKATKSIIREYDKKSSLE